MQDEDQTNSKSSVKNDGSEHNTDRGNDGATPAMLEKESVIDVGNEHNHNADGTDDSRSKPGIDPAADATSPEPGEGENDEPDTSGEDA